MDERAELEADARAWDAGARDYRARGFVKLAAECERQAAECRRELAELGPRDGMA